MKKAVFILLIASLLSTVFGAEPIRVSVMFDKVVSTAIKKEEEEKPIPPNNKYVAGTRYGKPIPDIDVNDPETDSFFENSLFLGDSLMVGFGSYCKWKGSNFMGGPLVLAVQSFTLKNANGPVTEGSLHPYFMGEKMRLEDIVVKSGVNKVFLFFGINDMVGLTAEQTEKEYNDLIYRIHEKAPSVKIYIIGTTYIVPNRQKNGFTNVNLRKLNDDMYKYSLNYDYVEFINIGDRLVDSTDGLNVNYSSDKYVHLTTEGYDVWAKVLKTYAKDFMAKEQGNDPEG